jgi:hypothetical protein
MDENMDRNVNQFVGWLIDYGQDFPAFSDKLIERAASSVKEGGYDKAKADVAVLTEASGAERMSMAAILDELKGLGIDKERGSYMVRRIDAIRQAGTSGDDHFTMSV